MIKENSKMKLGALYYPAVDQSGVPVNFDSLFIPYIYKEIYLDGIYIDVLNQREDMVIVDVGANIGITVDHFRSHAKKLYAIEPSPEHFTALKKNKEFNHWDNVELFNFAIADKDGEAEFRQSPNNRTTNSLVNPAQNPNWYGSSFKVPTKSMDHFFEENGIDQVDFMKFDVEGAEDLILRSEGFKKVASKIKAIEVEFHFPSWMDLVQYMADLGFTARRFDCSAIVILFSR